MGGGRWAVGAARHKAHPTERLVGRQRHSVVDGQHAAAAYRDVLVLLLGVEDLGRKPGAEHVLVHAAAAVAVALLERVLVAHAALHRHDSGRRGHLALLDALLDSGGASYKYMLHLTRGEAGCMFLWRRRPTYFKSFR